MNQISFVGLPIFLFRVMSSFSKKICAPELKFVSFIEFVWSRIEIGGREPVSCGFFIVFLFVISVSLLALSLMLTIRIDPSKGEKRPQIACYTTMVNRTGIRSINTQSQAFFFPLIVSLIAKESVKISCDLVIVLLDEITRELFYKEACLDPVIEDFSNKLERIKDQNILSSYSFVGNC